MLNLSLRSLNKHFKPSDGGEMIFGDLVDLKLPDICLIAEEKLRKNLTQETYPERGSNPGPLCDRRACCRLLHSGGLYNIFKCRFQSDGSW